MKKLLSSLLVVLLGLGLIGCNNITNNKPKEGVIKTSYTNLSEEYNIADGEIDLYYFDGSVLPYVEIQAYINLLDGLYYSKEFEFVKDYQNNLLSLNLYYVDEDDVVFEYSMDLNADLDTIYVETLDFFYLYIQAPETDYSEGLISLEPIYVEGSPITYNLAEYNFDLIIEDDEFLLPLVIANLIFNQGTYFDLYYNGEELYGIDTAAITNSEIKDIMKSKYNLEQVPEEIKKYNYDFYRLIIDYFYGLKDDRKITSGKDFIEADVFLGSNLNGSSKAIEYYVKELDDMHTSFIASSFYNNPRQEVNPFDTNNIEGGYVDRFYSGLSKVQLQARSYFKVTWNNYLDIPDYEYINNDETLIIYLTGFEVTTPVEIENIIKNAKATTKNIIIDLSLNTGGNIGSVLRMFALMTDKEIWYHSINPLNGEKVSYGVVGDKPAYNQYKYYIKQSSVTFSAANLTVAIAKELGIKTIGHPSSGGASSIGFFIFPDGSMILASSNMVLTNNKYESIEFGLEPDIYLDNLYNETEINNKLK